MSGEDAAEKAKNFVTGFMQDDTGHLSSIRLQMMICVIAGAGIGILMALGKAGPDAVTPMTLLLGFGVGAKLVQKPFEQHVAPPSPPPPVLAPTAGGPSNPVRQ
jgi:hypothetical protein